MKIIHSIAEMQSLSDTLRNQGRTISFVPTMGFLHEGHLSLMGKARQVSDTLVVSIFVNPTQFGPGEDLDRYPRDSEGDRRKCETAGVDYLFIPSAADMYPEKPSVFVTVEGLSDILEGAIRPGHFRGVATVVTKLFSIVRPHTAFFGQKDYQQCAVIKRLVIGLNLNVKIIVLPTVREHTGLAMSSRNAYLSDSERRYAAVIHRALSAAEQLIKNGIREPDKLQSTITTILAQERDVTIEYVAIVDPDSLMPLSSKQDRMVLLVAIRLGRTRLIDNLLIL